MGGEATFFLKLSLIFYKKKPTSCFLPLKEKLKVTF